MKRLLSFFAIVAWFAFPVSAEAILIQQQGSLVVPGKFPKNTKLAKRFKELIKLFADRLSVHPNLHLKTVRYDLLMSGKLDKCPNTHSIILHDKCAEAIKGQVGKKKTIIILSFKEMNGDIGFWAKVYMQDGGELLRYGKMSASRGDQCFDLHFKKMVKNIINTKIPQTASPESMSELPTVSCIPSRKVVLTMQTIVAAGWFLPQLTKMLRTKGFREDIVFLTPTREQIKDAVGCKNFESQCERDYAKQQKAEQRITVYIYRDEGKVHFEIKKYVPDKNSTNGEKEFKFIYDLPEGVFRAKGCRDVMVSSAFWWIARNPRSKVKTFLPMRCTKPPKTKVHQPIMISGIAAAGAGVILLGVGVTFGAMMSGTQSEFQSARTLIRSPADAQALVTVYDRGQSQATTANVMLGIGVPLAVIGGALIAVGYFNPFNTGPATKKEALSPPLPPSGSVVLFSSSPR